MHPMGLGALPVTKAVWPGASSPTGHPTLMVVIARQPQRVSLALPGAKGPGK